MRVARAYAKVIWRMIKHLTQSRHPDDFWAWLYKRVSDPSCSDFEDKLLVWYLLDDAIRDEEHVRVVAVYENFREVIENDLSHKRNAQIAESIERASSANTNLRSV